MPEPTETPETPETPVSPVSPVTPVTPATPARAAATAKRSTAKRSTAKRSTAKKPAGTRAVSTAGATPTPKAAASAAAAPKRVVEGAERAALVQIGATLLARDAMVGALGSLRSTSVSGLQARQRRFEQELERYEKRGTVARGRVQGDLRKASDRVTSEIQGLGKQATSARKDVAAGTDVLGARVGRFVQTGLSASSKTASKLGSRLPFGI